MIQSTGKIENIACTCISRLKIERFREHGLRTSVQFCLFLLEKLFSAVLLHFQCNNIGRTNTRYKVRAYLRVVIWVYLCVVMVQVFFSDSNLSNFTISI